MKKLLMIITAMVLCFGCKTLEEKANKEIDYVQTNNEDLIAQSKIPVEIKPVLDIKDSAWLGLQRKVENLPPIFKQKLMFNMSDSISLNDISELLLNLVDIPVVVDKDVYAVKSTGSTADSSAGGDPNKFTIHFNGGTLENLIDVICSKTRTNWEYTKGKIVISSLVTRSYRIYALPGSTSLLARIASSTKTDSDSGAQGQGGAGAASETEQKTEMKTPELSIWNSLTPTLKGMISENGKYSVSETSSMITVRDTIEVHKMVEEYVNSLNFSLTMQIFLNIQVLNVQLSDQDQYGLDWTLLAKDSNGSVSLVGTANSIATGSGYLKIAALNHAMSGSQAFIRALSKQGKVSQVTSASVATLNNQPVPIQVGEQKSYLAKISTTSIDGSATSSLEPGKINTGFNMTIIPSYLRGDELVLQVNMSLSELLRMETASSGSQTIQIPEIQTRNFLQRMRLKTGQTAIMTGFEQTKNSTGRKGIGKPSFYLLGGSRDAEQSKNMIVILITPILNQEIEQ